MKKKIKIAEEIVSPFLLLGLLHSIYNLKKYNYPEWYSDNLLKDSGNWTQKKLYIFNNFDEKRYTEIFDIFLKNNVLLPINNKSPAILPGLISKGELKKMLEK